MNQKLPSAEELIRPLIQEAEALNAQATNYLDRATKVTVTTREAFFRANLKREEEHLAAFLNRVSEYLQKATRVSGALARTLLAPQQSLNIQLVLALYVWQIVNLQTSVRAHMQAVETALSSKRIEANNKAALTIGVLAIIVAVISLVVSLTAILAGN